MHDIVLSRPSPIPTSPPLTDPKVSQPTTFINNMKLPGHRWFRYSAGYSGDWCKALIADRGARQVFDPFAGSGTSLLAAQAAGAESIGVEVHPLVARIGRAKLGWNQSPTALRGLGEDILREAPALENATRPTSDLIQRIYPEQAYRRLAALRQAVTESGSELALLALLGILRECSPAGTAQWQYVLPDRVKARVKDPYVAFGEKIDQIAGDIALMRITMPAPPSATMIEADIRQGVGVPDGWADLVVTSPPYANNFDYADATRIEMAFMGHVDSWADLKYIRDLLIRSCSQQMSGYAAQDVLRDDPYLDAIRPDLTRVYDDLAAVRLTRAGRKAYHTMIVAYFADLARAWRTVRAATRAGGECCWVVGDSAPYGVHVPVEEWLGRLALQAGFTSFRFEPVRQRNVKWENRKHRVPLQEGYLWVKG